MAIPLIPWEPHTFPKEIQLELNRRAKNRGFDYLDNVAVSWDTDSGESDSLDWNSYRGPMTAWVRFCSNSVGVEKKGIPNKEGFVMHGGKDFYSGYGFQRNEETGVNESLIGYTPEGIPHIIQNDLATSEYPIYVPPPEIEKISAVIQKEILRRVSVEWTCFSFKQLEYLTPYFLIPGITATVEWGWNHFNPLSLLDLTDTSTLSMLNNNPYSLYTDNILNSKGNYEVLLGMITNFEWSVDGNKIRCKTEVTSKDRIWAGMIVNSNMIKADQSDEQEENDSNGASQVIDRLGTFAEFYLDNFKTLVTRDNNEDAVVNSAGLRGLYNHLRRTHPDNYREYLYGVFYGRDERTQEVVANKDDDFDCKSSRNDLWLNMGLVVEIINYFSSLLTGTDSKELFRVDVDDCVINGHPNLISTDGNVLLIPNAMAPKYFAGVYGDAATRGSTSQIRNLGSQNVNEYRDLMEPSDDTFTGFGRESKKIKEVAKKGGFLYEYRLKKICLPLGGAVTHRDNLDKIINANRYRVGRKGDNSRFEFPFLNDYKETLDGGDERVYKGKYTGLFKNLYLHANVFKDIIKKSTVKTFPDLYREILEAINNAASNFWDLKLVASTGRKSSGDQATMKIVDGNMSQYTSNKGEVYTFDYYGADSVLTAIAFRPTLSNAQAIRTIYSQTNADGKKKILLSEQSQLLDYKFRDRLFSRNDESTASKRVEDFNTDSFKETMGRLQGLKAAENAFQMTYKQNDTTTIYRLAIPPENEDILTLLLDDGDDENNPRYTGIMPGIQAEFTLQGIAGIRTFSVFRVRGLPEPYSENNIVFRTINVNDAVVGGQWTTTIVAGIIPLKGFLASKLSITRDKDDTKND